MSPGVCFPRGFLQVHLIVFNLINPFSLSVIFLLFPYFALKLFYSLWILFYCPRGFFFDLLTEFSFVILEGPFLSVLLDPVPTSFESLFIHQYILIYFFQLYYQSCLLVFSFHCVRVYFLFLYTFARYHSFFICPSPIIPPPGPALDYGTKYNPSGSQPGLNDTNYGTPLPQPCPPPSSLSATAWKNRSKAPSRKLTIHCPAPRCDSLKERPMTTSERKRVYRQLKTEIRRVYAVKKKKNYNSDFCSR